MPQSRKGRAAEDAIALPGQAEATELLERKLHAQHEMQLALEKMDALQLLRADGQKLRAELPKQIRYLENEIKTIQTGENLSASNCLLLGTPAPRWHFSR
jgi:hypothetical protein